MIDAIYIYENKQIKIVYNFSGEYEELMKNYNDGEYMKRNTGRDKDLKLVPVVGMETEKVSSYFINQEL